MPLQQLFTSRKVYDAETFVGQEGKIFYDEATGLFRLGDGSTPGGKIVGNLAIAATGTTAPINPYEGELWYNPTTKELWAYHDGEFRGTINLATSSTLGGVRLGPGVILNAQDQIIIDSTGLDFSFGDFYAYTNTGTVVGSTASWLSSVNPNEDIVIASNGTGEIAVVGKFSVFAPDGPISSREPSFLIDNDGQITIRVPGADPLAGAVKIIGSASGLFSPPINTGVMLHVTGNTGDPSRLYNDGIGNFAAFVARRYNGSVTTSTAVLDGEEIMRLSGTAHNGTTIPGAGNQRIIYRALGNQTPTNQGGNIEFWTVAQNTTTLTKIATIDNADGITSTRFTGPLIGNVNATTVTATNITVTGNINGNLSGTTVTANSFVGTIITPAQPNITSVGTLTSLTLAGGTTSTYALKFNSGTLLTTAQTGAVEYDGAVFYATPLDQERGAVLSNQVYILNSDRALNNDTNPQSLFGAGFHVTAGKRYRYQILCTVTKTAGNSVSIGYGLLVNGGGSLSKHVYRVASSVGASSLTPSPVLAMRNSVTANFATPVDVTGALTNGASGSTFEIQGLIEVTASGYITPQITFLTSAPTGATLLGSATMAAWPVGSTGTNTVIGNWV